MGCCGEREKFGSATNEQRWDYINLNDFKSTSCWSGFSYGLLYFFLIISFAVYIVDIYTASNLLFFDRWSSQVDPAIPFRISRWIFAGCIFLSWILLAYRWWRAIRAMKSGIITASYLDPLAVRIESIRPGKAQGWRRFLVFTALTKGRKGSEYVALFTYFSFEAWLRIVFAEGPRQVINALTLYSVLQAKLIPVGDHAPDEGASPVSQFFINVRILADSSTQQATILFGMLYVLIVWVFTAIGLILAGIMYITFLWHHIPSADGSLSRFCQRKIEKRLGQIVRARVEKAIAKEHIERVKKVATGGAGASVGMPSQQMDVKREPTIPILDPNAEMKPTVPSHQPSASVDGRPASPFGFRPASPFAERPASPRPSFAKSALSKEATLPDLDGQSFRPGGPSRNATQTSMNSDASYASNAPLLSGAAEMGRTSGKRQSPTGPPRTDSDRSVGRGFRPPPRNQSVMSGNSQRSASAGPLRNEPPLRLDTGMTERSMTPGSQPRSAMSRDPYSASSTPSQRRPPMNFSRRPTQEYEMHPPTPASDRGVPTPASGYTPFNPSNRTPARSQTPNQDTQMDYFGQSRVPPRAGTAPVATPDSYDGSIYDAYGARNPRPPKEFVPFRPATTGPGPGPGSRPGTGNRWDSVQGQAEAYRPPKF